MEDLISKLEEILEVDNLDVKKKFVDYDEWDSLSLLAVLAMLDADYHMAMKGKQIAEFENIEAFCKEVLSHQ